MNLDTKPKFVYFALPAMATWTNCKPPSDPAKQACLLTTGKGGTLQSQAGGYSLLRGVVGKVDALLDVALQALNRSLEQGLLLLGDVADDVDGPLGAVGLGRCQYIWA